MLLLDIRRAELRAEAAERAAASFGGRAFLCLAERWEAERHRPAGKCLRYGRHRPEATAPAGQVPVVPAEYGAHPYAWPLARLEAVSAGLPLACALALFREWDAGRSCPLEYGHLGPAHASPAVRRLAEAITSRDLAAAAEASARTLARLKGESA